MPEVSDDTATDPAAEARIIRDVLRLTFRRFTEGGGTYRSHWLGVPAIKYPTDLMMYQELIVRRRPDLIVETGTRFMMLQNPGGFLRRRAGAGT